MTRVSEQELEQAIRAVGDEVVTMTDIIAGEAVYSPELNYSEATRPTSPYDMESRFVSVTGKLSGVPAEIRKKFQARFKRSHKPSWGYYRRTRNGRKEIAYGSPYRLPSGAFAMLSLYDWRDSGDDVEFVLTAADQTVAFDPDTCDHPFIVSPNAAADSEEIKAAVAEWAGENVEKYEAVGVWQNHWNSIRVGDPFQNFSFECFSVESFSLGEESVAKGCLRSVCAGLREAGMRFRLFDSDWLKASNESVEGNDPEAEVSVRSED